MDLDKHCELCDNQILDYQTGSICSLTNEKPQFNKVCPSILLNEKFEERLKEIIVEHRLLEKSKGVIYLHAIVFGSISLAIMLVGAFWIYDMYTYVSMHGRVFSKDPFIFIGLGCLFLPMVLAPLFSFRSSFKIAKDRKLKIHKLLSLFHITYKYEIHSWIEIHGNAEVDIEFKFKGREFIVPYK